MNKTRKRLLITVLCVAAVIACISTVFVLAADNGEAASDITMTNGAYIRVDDIADGGVTGLMFEATVPTSKADEWEAANDKVEYGMLIMPADYASKGELNEANVFAATGNVYTFDGDTRDTAGKTKIVNVRYSKALLMTDNSGNSVIRGTIASVQYTNLDRAFTARAYAKLTKDGNVSYVMADTTSTRSVVQVAHGAYKTGDDALASIVGESRVSAVKAWCLDTINTSLTYRINAVKGITPTAENIASFDKAYAKVVNLYNILGKDYFNANVLASDIEAVNANIEAAKTACPASGYKLVGSASVTTSVAPVTTVPNGYTAVNKSNAGTLANFIALLNATPAGNFALTEDLDFGGEISGAVIKNFTGILDGQGHKISNFEIKYGQNAAANDYISVIFEKNSGTIKNIAFDYTLGTANNSNVGLIMQNDGTIQNVYVNVNFKAYQWTTGAIAAINGSTGKVLNCVTNLNTTLTDQAAKNRLGSIVGVDYNGTITNCYAIVNGIHTLATPYVDTWGHGNYTGSKNYADMAAFVAEVTSLPGADGWSNYWYIANGEPMFGARTALNMTNAGTPDAFKALVDANPNGTFFLTENLDWTGEATNAAGIAAFSGTLDGQGYSIKGLSIGFTDTDYNCYWIKSNSGTIKNIGIDYTLAQANNNFGGLITTNTGTIENANITCYVNGITILSDAYDVGGVAAINSGNIKNCIVKMTVGTVLSGSTIPANGSGTPVIGAITSNNNGGTVSNCYYSTDYAGMVAIVKANGTATSVSVLPSPLTILLSANGWSSYWKATDANGNSIDSKYQLIDAVGYVKTHEGTALNMTNAGTPAAFKALIDANPSGTFYLTEDLNWTGMATNVAGIAAFSGILDGQGYSIKGLSIGFTDTDYNCYWIKSNSGTIKNIGIDYTLAQANNNVGGLITTNTGTIENAHITCYVNGITILNEAYNVGGVASTNNGTIANCIVEMTVGTVLNGSTIPTNTETGKPAIAVIAAYSQNTDTSVIKNCYYSTNYEGMLPVMREAGGHTRENILALPETLTALPEADGWSAYWSVEGGVATIRNTTITENVNVTLDKGTNPDFININGASASLTPGSVFEFTVEITDNAYQALVTADGQRIAPDANGVYRVYVIKDTAIVVNADLKDKRIKISKENAATLADFIELLNATPDGEFVLTEDLDFGGAESSTLVRSFTGTLDGDGHKISNFNIKYGHNTAQDDYFSVLIESNSGTIKDIAFDYTLGTVNSNKPGLIMTNTGTIQNVYVKCLWAANTGEYTVAGSLTSMNNGTIENCYAEVTVKDGVTIATGRDSTYSLGLITGHNSGTGVMNNCYAVSTNGTNYGHAMFPWATQTNCQSYDSVAAFEADESKTAFDAANGWSEHWATFIPADNRIKLDMTNAGTPDAFAALLGENPAGDFVLTEDLVWTDKSNKGVLEFTGTLDGDGHTITGLDIDLASADSSRYPSVFFVTNKGTIKNIGIKYTLNRANSTYISLIENNYGTVENVCVDVTVNAINWGIGGIAGNFDLPNDTGAVIKNCVVSFNLGNGVSVNKDTFGAIAVYNKPGNTVENCYAIVNGTGVVAVTHNSVPSDTVKTVNDASEITALSGEGWSSAWSVANGNVSFGNMTIEAVNMTLPAQTLSANTDKVYPIDLSGVQGTISTLTVNDTDRLGALSGTTLNLPVNGVGAAVQNVVATTTTGKTYNLTVTCEDLITTIVVHADYENFVNWDVYGNTEIETWKKRALYDFVDLYKQMTGIDLEVKTVYSAADGFGVDYSKNNLIVGERLASAALLGDNYLDGLTTDTGYKILKSGKNVFIYGKTGFGMINGLYALLEQQFGAKFYSDDVYTSNSAWTGATMKLGAIENVTFNPSVDYNWAIDGDMYTYKEDGTKDFNYRAIMRLGFVNSWMFQNSGYHDSANLLDGQTTASDWILNLTGDSNESFKNLNWSATSTAGGKTLAQAIAAVMANKINANTQMKLFFIGVPDNVPADQSKYGTSTQYLAFMNAVAAELENLITRTDKIELVMMAYAGAIDAPTSGTFYNGTKVDVKAMYAPIRMLQNYDADNDVYKNLDGKTVKWFMDNYEAWKTHGDEGDVYVWNYSANFSNFFMPTDTIGHMLSQYQAFVGNGIDHMMNQGYQSSPVQTNFAALKTYLKGQLAKNVNITPEQYDQLIRDFCNAYYGAAGEIMYDLLKVEETHMNGIQNTMSGETIYYCGDKMDTTKLDISSYYYMTQTKGTSGWNWDWITGGNSGDVRSEMLRDVYWGGSTNIFTSWYAKITEALDCSGLTAEQKQHIQVEAIAIRYMSLKVHGEAVVSGDTMAKIAADAKAYGITMYSEGGSIDNLS